MKIAFQGSVRDPSKPYSSVWACELDYLRALAKIDDKNQYLLFNFGLRHTAELAKNMADPRAPNFRTYVPRLSRRLIAFAEDRLGFDPRGWLLRRRGADFLHVYEQIYPVPPRYPTIVTYLDLLAEQHPEWTSPDKVRALRVNARRALHCIAISESTKKNLMRFYHLPEERVTVIPLGIDHDLFKPMEPGTSRPLRGKLRLPERYLMCIGPFSPRKNLDYALDAYPLLKRRHPDVGLVMTGSRTAGRDLLEARVRRENLADVHFVGEVEREDLAALYNGAAALIYPSPYIGLPILEAMACGCPVAAIDNEAIPDMAGTAAAVFRPDLKEYLAAAIDRILEDAGYRRALIARGVQQAGRFTWEETARKTLALYERIADELARRT